MKSKLATVRVSMHDKQNDNLVNFYFNEPATKLLLCEDVVIDKTKLRVRFATIDDKKTYRVNRINEGKGSTLTAKMPNAAELIGQYEIEDEGNYLQMYLIEE